MKKCPNCGKEIRIASRMCRTCSNKSRAGRVSPLLGRILSEETKSRISKSLRKLDRSGERNSMYGKHHSEKTKERLRKYWTGKRKGKDNPNWKCGEKCVRGYVYVYKPKSPMVTKYGYVMRSRLLMSESIGRELKPEEVVHHINGIKDDDRLENLKLFPNNTDHILYHNGDI